MAKDNRTNVIGVLVNDLLSTVINEIVGAVGVSLRTHRGPARSSWPPCRSRRAARRRTVYPGGSRPSRAAISLRQEGRPGGYGVVSRVRVNVNGMSP